MFNFPGIMGTAWMLSTSILAPLDKYAPPVGWNPQVSGVHFQFSEFPTLCFSAVHLRSSFVSLSLSPSPARPPTRLGRFSSSWNKLKCVSESFCSVRP